ncbi:MAG: reverse transcriptase domain-containing protein [Pseudomonadota bacterium]
MWTVRGLFPTLCDPAHLDRAITAATAGKRRRRDVAWLLFRREEVVADLAARLAAGTWEPAGYEIVRVRDPKPRAIARAPIEDRVVHAAVVACLEPVLYRGLRPEAFACRPGFGTHRAVLRLLDLMRRHRFALHLDICAYFPSIDVAILRALLARRVRDAPFLEVVDRILESGAGLYRDFGLRTFAGLTDAWPPPGRGLPIGACTSQVLAAHLYLEAFDHFVKRDLRVQGYLRYVDDQFLFGDRRADLLRWRGEIARWLETERGLRLKHPEARVLSCHGHLDALGFRLRREGVEPRARTLTRMQARVRAAVRPGRRDPAAPEVGRSLAATAGLAMFAAMAGRVRKDRQQEAAPAAGTGG